METLSSRSPSALCAVCNKELPKYRCPACDIRSCSADCVKEHKVQTGCTGKRARTKHVAPLNSFTDDVLLRDFGLLEEVDAAVDRANRDLRIRDEELRLYQPKRHKMRIELARACAVPERQMRLILAPFAMSLARENTSRVVDPSGKGKRKGKGKGKGKKGSKTTASESKPVYISWRVDWHFGACGQVLTDRSTAEHEVVGQVLERFLKNSWSRGPTRHLLLPYAEQGIDELQVFLQQPLRARAERESWKSRREMLIEEAEEEMQSEEEPPAKRQNPELSPRLPPPPPPPPPPPKPGLPSEESEESEESSDAPSEQSKAEESEAEDHFEPFARLDLSRTLRENLMDKAIVEYPVLHVALPQEVQRFLAE